MDALTLLIADHNRVRGLFERFTAASDADDVATMAELADQMRTELEVHTTIEEEIFYPAVRGLSDEIADTVAEGLEEHHQVEVLLEELTGLSPGDDAWKAKWTVVIEDVDHHADEEESELFPKVRSHTDADTRSAWGDELDARKGALGAPTMADRIDLTVEEVRDLASEQQIPGRSKLSTDELRAAVQPG
jgi:hemerythrin superfamily protein